MANPKTLTQSLLDNPRFRALCENWKGISRKEFADNLRVILNVGRKESLND